MQFVANGPDIPEGLLQAHEEGRVVFFCGAGISYPAGLPGFKGLVDQIYSLNGTSISDIENESYRRGHYDATLDLLERRLPGQRLAVRRALAESLEPKLDRIGATETQTALLRLARSRDGSLRLVTTNFDRIFHEAASRTGESFQSYAAPMLPIPKNSRWNGLVHLHGLLPETADDTALNRLVATSGDFGLAYLTERWAARFVSELFRNYVVCFIGYSIDDPVLRYMMDALAADRMLGEMIPQAWALGECEPGLEATKTLEWKAKGVTPILYSVPASCQQHSALHQTLHVWAETYRDGVQGKEAIVVKHAMAQPQASTVQDDFVGRMLWALSDKSGLPAKRFADLNPAPSLDWLLEPFAQERYLYEHLILFGVASHGEPDQKLIFSLVRRPVSHDRAPPMLLASGKSVFSQWDIVMFHLARWLVRHLDDPRLVIWVAERGGRVHERWAWLIEGELERLAKLKSSGDTSELESIRQQSPSGIPSPSMRALWRLILSERIKAPWPCTDIYRWQSSFRREGLTTTLRLELRNLLAPKITVKRPFRYGDEDVVAGDDVTRVSQLVNWELVPAADHVRAALHQLDDAQWKTALPVLLPDFQQLLRDTLDLSRELGGADDRNDRSHWDLPSITPHWQNRGFREWVSVIELVRDAWLAFRDDDRAGATQIAQAWFAAPYPTYKRLAFFAASHDESISSEQWVDWLLTDDAYWLWHVGTRREVLRIFVLQGAQLSESAQRRLEEAILAGPPRDMYRDGLDVDAWTGLVEHAVWRHLAKLEASGLVLSTSAAARVREISSAHPKWVLAGNEQDEFLHWMSGTGDPDFEASRDVSIAPRKRSKLTKWLRAPVPDDRPLYEDTWQEVCRTRFFQSLAALCDLARADVWPSGRWREALQVWAEDDLVSRSWRYGALLVRTMPDSVLLELDHAVSWWMQAASKFISRNEDILVDLSLRLLALPINTETGMTRNGKPIDEPVSEAINHPIGHITQALLNLWFKRHPNDNDSLPPDLEPAFTELCDARVDRFRHGRALLASRLNSFFRVDRAWSEDKLLKFFDWSNPSEARVVWAGFLWSPRLNPALLQAFKAQFLDTAAHYADLSEHRQQYSAFLTYAALGYFEGYNAKDFRAAIGKLPREGLEECAQALGQALEGAAGQREDYWRNRIAPFWQEIWPKSIDLTTAGIAASLANMVIAARGEFPSALRKVRDWLHPIEHPDHIVHVLRESGLCTQYPSDSLDFLSVIVSSRQGAPLQLGECLTQILRADSKSAQKAEFQRLNQLVRG